MDYFYVTLRERFTYRFAQYLDGEGGNDNEYWKAKETTNNAHIGHYCGRWTEGLGTRKFALTRSSSSSRVAPSLGKRPLWSHGQNNARHGRKTRNIQREATCATRRPSSLPDLIKSVLHPRFLSTSFILLPVGSGSAGNTSLPQIAQTAAAEIMPAKPFASR